MALAGLGLVTRAAGWAAVGAAQTPIVQGSALAGLGPDFKFDVSKKRPATLQLIGGDSKRLRLSDFAPAKSKSRRLIMARRRFSRRRPRRNRRLRKRRGFRRFAKRVRGVLLRTIEPKDRLVANSLAQAMREGDGTTRSIYVHTPVQNLIQGILDQEFVGNKFYLKGVGLRGQLSLDTTTPSTTGALVRFTLLFTKDQADGMDDAFNEYTSITTPITNPTQVPPNVNPRFFKYTSQPFVGTGYTAPFDTTRHKVIRSFTVPVNPGGDVETGQLSMPTPFKCYVPIKRMMQLEDSSGADLSTPPNRFKYGTYWWVVQCVMSAAGVSTDTVVNMAYQSHVYFRDV